MSIIENKPNIDITRIESRYGLCTDDLQDHILPTIIRLGYKEKRYPNNIVQTVNFGPEANKFMSGASLKYRTYLEEGEVFDSKAFFIPDSTGLFEIKLALKSNPNVREKFRIPTSFSEIRGALSSRDNLQTLKNRSLLNSQEQTLDIDLLNHIFTVSDVDGVVPITLSQYERRHFISPDEKHRVTIDQNIGLYSIVSGFDGNLYASFLVGVAGAVIETKEQEGTNEPLLKAYLKDVSDDAPSKIKLFDFAYNTSHITNGLIKPDELIEGTVEKLLEREEKFRLVGTEVDHREILMKIKLPKDTGVQFVEQETYRSSTQRFVVIDSENGICILGRPQTELGMKMKYKKTVSSDNGFFIRDEAIADINPDEMRKALEVMNGNPDDALGLCDFVQEIEENPRTFGNYRITPYFERNRTYRQLVDNNTGDIFFIIADNCVAADGRPNLRQFEIEHYGRVDRIVKGNFKMEAFQKSIEGEYAHVSRIIRNSLLNMGYPTETDTRTKFAWISSEF